MIWNPNSGSATACADLLADLRARADVTVVESRSGDDARKLATLAGKQSELVVAAGGDGSINGIATALHESGSPATLGVLPLGSGNDFARNLNMPLDPELAAKRLLTADLDRDTIQVDLIEATFKRQRRTYANMATGGNSGDVLNLLDEEVKQRWGPLCYVRGAASVMTDLQVYSASVRLDDEEFSNLPLLNVLVANGRCTGGGLNVAPHARMDDGLMDVLLILDGTPINIAAMSAQLLVSDYTQSDLVIWRQARSITIQSEPGMKWTTDGEPVECGARGHNKVSFHMRKAAMPVIVGAKPSTTQPSVS
mgnify:CR=1 FL=1